MQHRGFVISRLARAVVWGLLPVTAAVIAAEETTVAPVSESRAVERISVQGRRLAASTEMNEETARLLKVAGIMNDPLAATFSLPGVVFAGSDFGGLPAVRGSSPDDNAFLIDGMPAGYLFHLFGHSVLNEQLLHDFKLEAAAFGPQYGDSTGGVFAATLRKPRFEPIGGQAELSLLQMGVLLEGQLSDSQAFYLAGRQSTLQYLLGKDDELDEGVKMYRPPQSFDYQARHLVQLTEHQQLMLTLTGAGDEARANISKTSEQGRTDPESVGDARVDMGFANQSLSWQWQPATDRQVQLQFQRSRQTEDNLFGNDQFIRYTDTQQRIQLSSDWQLNAAHRLLGGTELSHRRADYQFDVIPYYCTDHQPDCFDQRGDRLQADDRLRYRSQAFYIQHQWQWHPQWRWSLGLRDDRQDYTKEHYLQPRAELQFQHNEQLRWFARAGRYSRAADLDKSLPLLGNRQLRQPLANHYVLGNQWQFAEDWQLQSEIYLKNLQKLPLALTDEDADEALHYSNDSAGRAYGAELLLRKDAGQSLWHGWASLSWSASERTNLRTGERRDYVLDTPLVANLVIAYPWRDDWDLSLRLTVRSGARYTPIVGTKPNPYYPEYLVARYGELNSATLPVYHRLDLQAEQQGQLMGLPVTYTYAILNVLNRRNVSGYYLLNGKEGAAQSYSIEAEENLGILPSVGIKVRF